MSKQRILGDLAHNLDSSAVGSFLAKSSAGGDFKKVSYSLVSGTPSALDSSLSQAIIDSAYIQARQTAAGTAGLDSATMLALIDSSYISGIHGTNTGFDQYYYNATAGQTIFDSDLRGRNLSYEENGVMVFLNGVMLAPSQYTATDGSTVVLDSAASLSDEVTVVKFGLGGSSGGGGAAAVWYGDRGMVAGGNYSLQDIEYFDITTTGNAADFGDLAQTSLSEGDAASNATYGLFMGGYAADYSTQIDYVTISTLGNAQDFGDITETKYRQGALSNGTYALSFGGYTSGNQLSNVIDYVAIATPGNSSDFGDLGQGSQKGAGAADSTRGVMNLGWLTGSNYLNTIEYVTIASPGNATDFGDLSSVKREAAAVSDGTYIIFAGGYNYNGSSHNHLNVIEYATIQTAANTTDFGDLSVGRSKLDGANNATRATFSGGYNGSSNDVTIDYITMASTGNASDFGDLATARANTAGGTSGSPS